MSEVLAEPTPEQFTVPAKVEAIAVLCHMAHVKRRLNVRTTAIKSLVVTAASAGVVPFHRDKRSLLRSRLPSWWVSERNGSGGGAAAMSGRLRALLGLPCLVRPVIGCADEALRLCGLPHGPLNHLMTRTGLSVILADVSTFYGRSLVNLDLRTYLRTGRRLKPKPPARHLSCLLLRGRRQRELSA